MFKIKTTVKMVLLPFVVLVSPIVFLIEYSIKKLEEIFEDTNEESIDLKLFTQREFIRHETIDIKLKLAQTENELWKKTHEVAGQLIESENRIIQTIFDNSQNDEKFYTILYTLLQLQVAEKKEEKVKLIEDCLDSLNKNKS